MCADFLHYSRLPWPTDWSALFGRAAPLLVEIGFGGGQFLVDLARRRPDANIVGIEISLPSLRKGARKVANAGLDHARVLQGDSRAALWLLFAPQSIREVYINFPDPWPKAGHEQRRLVSDDFLRLLATRMEPGGYLEIATDVAAYAAAIVDVLERADTFASRLSTPYTTADTTRLRTKYEQIAREEGRTCHYFKWQRTAVAAPAAFAVPKEYPMPHVVLRLPLSTGEIADRFEPFHVAAGDLNIKYIEAFRSAYDQKLLVDTYISEEPYHQRLCLAIRPRPQGDMVVGLHEVGFPRPTAGVHVAVHHLIAWLQSLHDDTAIVSSTLNLPAAAEK